MNWETLQSDQQFLNLLDNEPLFAVFKHSTRCGTSSMAKNRVERDWNFDFPIYFLDLIKYRSLSNLIAERSGIDHESPQLIVFKNGKAVYDASHNGIIIQALKEELIS
jgi:bacillithiol system protein YtxJ